MKYADRRAFEGHLTALRQKKQPLWPVYLLLAKDEWQRQLHMEQLWQSLPPAKERCIRRWRGGQVTERQIKEELDAFDLFGSERVFVITDCEAFNKDTQRCLSSYIAKAQKDQLFILSATTLSSATSLYQASEQKGALFAAETLRTRDKEQLCDSWLCERAHLSGKQLSSAAAAMLRRQIGIQYDLLIQELDKLMTYSGEETLIDEQAVAAVCQTVPSDTAWQVGEYLLQNDSKRALLICQRLLHSGTALIALVRQIRRQFQTAFEVADLPLDAISVRYPQLKDFMIERQQRLAYNYGRARLPAAICALDACELAFKNGCDDEELLLERLIVQLAIGMAPPLALPLGTAYVC